MGEDIGQGPAGGGVLESWELWDGNLAGRVQNWEQLLRAADLFGMGMGRKLIVVRFRIVVGDT